MDSIKKNTYSVGIWRTGPGLAISDKKNYSMEDGINRTSGLFPRNSGCSPKQKILGIPFQTIPQRRKMLRILCCETK
jgi:hypothetical protein